MRDERWQKRMAEVDARAREELPIDEERARKVLSMQAELRQFKGEIRKKMIEGGMDVKEAGAKISERVHEFKKEVAALLGVERGAQYFKIVDEVRAADPGRHAAVQ